MRRFLLASLMTCGLVPGAFSQSIVPRNLLPIDSGTFVGVSELSGIAFGGPVVADAFRFWAVQDSGGQAVAIDVTFGADGTLLSAKVNQSVSLPPAWDGEAITFLGPDRSRLLVSDETSPQLMEVDVGVGFTGKSVPLPAIYSNIRHNRGIESLSRAPGGHSIWTANEEALVGDGDLATDATGTIVRLQQFDDLGDSLIAQEQYAYPVDPIHASQGDNDATRSGLVDLVAFDSGLLALERSLASSLIPPPYESRVYLLDFANATNVATSEYASGLIGTTYTPVAKILLWSGPAGGGLGQNLEGLALGPQLPNGNSVLLGIVDNGDPLSSNSLIAFELSGVSPRCGDYNCNGAVDAADYTVWKDHFGSQDFLAADGNGNRIVDAADYTVWKDGFGDHLRSPLQPLYVPESRGPAGLAFAAPLFWVACRKMAGRH
ncbi:MAG: esterase-like activity of phytase family protein [Pirellulaceae bacterium]